MSYKSSKIITGTGTITSKKQDVTSLTFGRQTNCQFWIQVIPDRNSNRIQILNTGSNMPFSEISTT